MGSVKQCPETRTAAGAYAVYSDTQPAEDLSNPYPALRNDGAAVLDRKVYECLKMAGHKGQCGSAAQRFWPEQYDAAMLRRQHPKLVRDPLVESQRDPVFGFRRSDYSWVRRSTQSFFGNGVGGVAQSSESFSQLCREILINLEFHPVAFSRP